LLCTVLILRRISYQPQQRLFPIPHQTNTLITCTEQDALSFSPSADIYSIDWPSMTGMFLEQRSGPNIPCFQSQMLKIPAQKKGPSGGLPFRAMSPVLVHFRCWMLRQSRSLLGVGHLDTIRAAAWLAAIYGDLGRYGEAEELEKDILHRRRMLLGVDHPDTISASENLAGTCYQLDRAIRRG